MGNESPKPTILDAKAYIDGEMKDERAEELDASNPDSELQMIVASLRRGLLFKIDSIFAGKKEREKPKSSDEAMRWKKEDDLTKRAFAAHFRKKD